MNFLLAILAGLTLTACTTSPKTQSSLPAPITGYAPVNGIKMYYEIHGQGRPLVLIHGGGSNIQSNFSQLIPLLAKNHQVIAVDELGHGRTADPGRAHSFEATADDVSQLLKFLKIEKADIFGFSNGGNSAMQLAIRHPTQVNKLIVSSAFYRRDGMVNGFWEGMKKGTLADMPEELKAASLKINPDPKHLENMYRLDSQRMLKFKDWPDAQMKKIKAPTLFMCGDQEIVRVEHCLKMSRLLPNARLMIFPGGHGDYLGEVFATKNASGWPEVTSLSITEFLK